MIKTTCEQYSLFMKVATHLSARSSSLIGDAPPNKKTKREEGCAGQAGGNTSMAITSKCRVALSVDTYRSDFADS